MNEHRNDRKSKTGLLAVLFLFCFAFAASTVAGIKVSSLANALAYSSAFDPTDMLGLLFGKSLPIPPAFSNQPVSAPSRIPGNLSAGLALTGHRFGSVPGSVRIERPCIPGRPQGVAESVVAIIEQVLGSVMVDTGKGFQLATPGTMLKNGDRVVTLDDSRVRIVSFDCKVTMLDPGNLLRVGDDVGHSPIARIQPVSTRQLAASDFVGNAARVPSVDPVARGTRPPISILDQIANGSLDSVPLRGPAPQQGMGLPLPPPAMHVPVAGGFIAIQAISDQ